MSGVEKRSISLSSELAAEIDAAVAAGEYGNASEVVREALREWKERRGLFGYSVEELRALIQEGIDSGPPQPFTEEVVERIKERARQRLKDRQGQTEQPT